ncbi:MAG: type VII toxin-antitoxin system HepT family RNase toxin [Polyangiaceae bacterium]
MMVDADVIARRLLALNESLRELGREEASNAAELAANPILRAAVERWLQIAIEACIDIAYHVVAEEGWTPPESGRAAFVSLAAHGKLPLDLAERLGSAAALRNLLIHDYVAVDLQRLALVVRDDLGDLRELAARAAGWMTD